MPWDNSKNTAADPDNPNADEQLTASEWNTHVDEGHWPSDELQVGVDNGDPVLTDPQNGDQVVLRYDRSAGSWVVDALEADTATVNNATFIRATRGSDSSSTSANSFVNIYDSESKDNRAEFNASAQFVPDETGEYEIDFAADIRGNTTKGDDLEWRIKDVDANETLRQSTDGAPSSVGQCDGYAVVNLTGGNTHEIQIRNKNSSFVVKSTPGRTEATIKRCLIQ